MAYRKYKKEEKKRNRNEMNLTKLNINKNIKKIANVKIKENERNIGKNL